MGKKLGLTQDPIVLGISVYEATRNDGFCLEILVFLSHQRGAEQVNILNNSMSTLICQLYQARENDSCAQGEAHECDRASSKVPVSEGICENESR